MAFKTIEEKRKYEREYYRDKNLLPKKQDYYIRNKARIRERVRVRQLDPIIRKNYLEYCRNKYHELRKKVLSYYSAGLLVCACCGENRFEFLEIDHINGDGKEHRDMLNGSGAKVYRWIHSHKFPEGFQVLCVGCNSMKKKRMVCPCKWGNGGKGRLLI